MTGKCDARWWVYCASYTLSGILVLAWFLHPSNTLAYLVLAFISAGYAAALSIHAGAAWLALAASDALLALAGLEASAWWSITTALAAAGTLAAWMASRRKASGVLIAAAAPGLVARGLWAAAAATLALASASLAADSRRLHVLSTMAAALVVPLAGPQWASLGSAVLVGASTTVVGALGVAGCPFRSENSLVGIGSALAGASLLLYLASGWGAAWLDGRYIESIEALGLILLVSGLLAPKPPERGPLGYEDSQGAPAAGIAPYSSGS